MASHKDRNLHIRLTEEESETLKKYAKENNTTQSDVLRDHIKTLETNKGKTE
jgi:protein-arginine kinase activator protein McsA